MIHSFSIVYEIAYLQLVLGIHSVECVRICDSVMSTVALKKKKQQKLNFKKAYLKVNKS